MSDWESERRQLERGFGFLENIGFGAPEASLVASRLVGDSLVLRYQHAAGDRQVNITYNKGSQGDRLSLVLTIQAGSRSFLLNDYLKSIGRPQPISAASGSAGVRDEPAFIDAAAAGFREVAEGPLARTLAGLEWPSVEFDWKGLR